MSETAPDSLLEKRSQFRGKDIRWFLSERSGAGKGGFPIGLDLKPALGVDSKGVTGRHLADSTEDGARGVDESRAEEFVECFRVELQIKTLNLPEHLQFRAKDHPPTVDRVVEGFLPEAVDREEERTLDRIPECEGEHAHQILETGGSPILKEMEERLGVARGVESEPRLETLPEFPEVVDLAIEDEPGRPVGIRHRLMTVGEVDDAQSAESQADGAVDVDPLLIRTAVMDPPGHGGDDVPIHRFVRAKVPDAADAAHLRSARNAKPSVPMSATHSIR